MLSKWSSCVTASVVLLLVGITHADPIIIDDFSCGTMTVPLAVDDITAQDSITQAPVSCAIGNQRDLVLDFVTDGGVNGSEAFVQDGLLYHNNDSGTESELTAMYGEAGDLNADLTVEGAFGIDIVFEKSDQGAQVRLTITEDGTSRSFTKDTAAGPTTVLFLYSEFPGLAFTSVDKIGVLFTNRDGTAAVDLGIGEIRTHVPEPATAIMIVAGLSAGAVARRTRRRR